MKKLILLYLAVLLGFSYSSAKEKQTFEVPINIGVGPALFWIPDVAPGIEGNNLHPGAQLELYAVITPKVIQENKNRIPKKYQKFISTKEEAHIKPLWLSLVPRYLILSQGDHSHVYGAIWSFYGLGLVFFESEHIKSKAQLVLPTVSYIHVNAPRNKPDGQHLFGIGGMARLENNIKLSDNFLVQLAYGHNLNVPLGSNTYTKENSTEHKWIQAGVLSLVLNFRFNTTQSL